MVVSRTGSPSTLDLHMNPADPRASAADVAPTVLVIGGFLTSPPLYASMRRRLLASGAAAVVVAPVWLPDWLLAAAVGLGPIARRCARALDRAAAISASSSRSRGAPILVVGHSAGGIVARLLTAPEPFDGRRFDLANRIGAIVTLGTPHDLAPSARVGRQRAVAATSFAAKVVPGARFAPTTAYLAVSSRAVVGRRSGTPRERAAIGLYEGLRPTTVAPDGAEPEGDGLVPVASALLEGADSLVLDGVVHGQLAGRPWYGSSEAIDVWWPRALHAWRSALEARAG